MTTVSGGRVRLSQAIAALAVVAAATVPVSVAAAELTLDHAAELRSDERPVAAPEPDEEPNHSERSAVDR